MAIQQASPTGHHSPAASGEAAGAGVRIWLYCLAALVFAMVVVGGATRLTDSGLSITEWKPILGIIPPLNDIDWQSAFEKYKQIPEYELVNKGMELAAFKFIFWWEWAHRFLGRLIGFAFAIPFALFLVRRQIPRSLIPRLAGILALGGLQGFIGWYMVQSGLAERVDVSQYRLALHLSLAVLIFGLILWTALGLRPRDDGEVRLATLTSGQRWSARWLLGLLFAQIVLGAFVAGTKAGLAHNTWPLMDGQIIPDGLGAISPWYRNLFENTLTVQFNHRIAAYVVAVLAAAHAVSIIRSADDERIRASAGALLALVLAQIVMGIWTLLAQVPLWLGLIHQAGAVVVFAAAVWHLHRISGADAK